MVVCNENIPIVACRMLPVVWNQINRSSIEERRGSSSASFFVGFWEGTANLVQLIYMQRENGFVCKILQQQLTVAVKFDTMVNVDFLRAMNARNVIFYTLWEFPPALSRNDHLHVSADITNNGNLTLEYHH